MRPLCAQAVNKSRNGLKSRYVFSRQEATDGWVTLFFWTKRDNIVERSRCANSGELCCAGRVHAAGPIQQG